MRNDISTASTRLLLVRHGHVPGISPERFRGRVDIELTEQGVAEARRTGVWIARHWQPTAVYTSPLKRCRDTGTAIAAPCGLTIEVLASLTDLNYGDWQWRTHDEVAAESPVLYRCWRTNPQLMRIPNGESLQELVARAADSFRVVAQKHATETIVMVAHESLNRALLLQLLDQPLSAYHALAQDPCAINEIMLSADRAVVLHINQTSHLEGPVER
jgi:phosphoserine phosphatase